MWASGDNRMNGRVAKMLRRAANFYPHGHREYHERKHVKKEWHYIFEDGKFKHVPIQVTKVQLIRTDNKYSYNQGKRYYNLIRSGRLTDGRNLLTRRETDEAGSSKDKQEDDMGMVQETQAEPATSTGTEETNDQEAQTET